MGVSMGEDTGKEFCSQAREWQKMEILRFSWKKPIDFLGGRG
jgi:hypothetical protein